jgi:hypothetical protein
LGRAIKQLRPSQKKIIGIESVAENDGVKMFKQPEAIAEKICPTSFAINGQKCG